MSPDEFLQGEDFEVTSADEFLSGEDFSIDNEESDYAPIPKKKGFYKSYSDALRGLGTGLVKGAASTLGTVPRNITKVVTNATDISIRKKLTDQAERINEINDRLLDQMRQTTDPLKKEKINKLIQGNIDTLKMLRTTGADISAEIEGFASGFEEGALELVAPDGTFEKIGFTTEKIAEFFVPGNFVKGATQKIAAQHMPRLLESIARIGLNTAAPTVVSVAQQGEINKEVGQTAMYAGAFSAVSEGMRVLSNTPAGQNLTKWLTEKLPGRKLNKIVRPATKEFDFGKNPGQTVSQEGIVANTRGELLSKIGSRKQEVGSQIDDVLTKASNSDTSAALVDDVLNKTSKSDTSAALGYVDRITQTQKNIGADRDFLGTNSDLIRVLKKDIIDNLSPKGIGANDFKISQKIIDQISALDDTAFSSVDDLSKAAKDIIGQGGQTRMDVLNNILDPIKKAKEQAIRTGDKALFSRLDGLEQGLTKNFTEKFAVIGDKNLSSLAPKEVQSLKIQVGKDTTWTGQAFDKDLNKVQVAIYRNLDSALDKVAPGIDVLNQRYAGLLTAEKALERSSRIIQRNVEIGLRATGIGGVVGGVSLARGDSGPTSILKGVLGAATFQLLGSTAVQTRTANFLTKLTPANQIQFVNIVKNIVLGAKASNNEDK